MSEALGQEIGLIRPQQRRQVMEKQLMILVACRVQKKEEAVAMTVSVLLILADGQGCWMFVQHAATVET